MDYLGPILVAIFLWWFGTGAVLFAVGKDRQHGGLSLLATLAVGAIGLYGLGLISSETTPLTAQAAFFFAILVWGCVEFTFLTGQITGWRKTVWPPNTTDRARFIAAFEALVFHEAALLGAGAAIAFVTLGAPNQVALWTFVLLWIMRLSAKLNIFLGVKNITEEFMPNNLTYIKSYFGKNSVNYLLPISITAATLSAGILVLTAVGAGAGTFAGTAYLLLATLMTLAVIEHWFMILPFPAETLWKWGMSEIASEQTDKTSVTSRKTQIQERSPVKLQTSRPVAPPALKTVMTSLKP